MRESISIAKPRILLLCMGISSLTASIRRISQTAQMPRTRSLGRKETQRNPIQEIMEMDLKVCLSLWLLQRRKQKQRELHSPSARSIWMYQKVSLLYRYQNKRRAGLLVCIVGRVGTGKTALISGMINELRQVRGTTTFGGKVSYGQ